MAKVPPLHAATAQCLCSTAILLPLVLLVDRPWTMDMPAPATWGALLGIALVSTALAYVIFFRIIAVAGAQNVMLVAFLVPVSALAMGVLLLGEPILPASIAGMALIAAGLAAIDGRLLRRLRPSG
jgi:drug/metabolite transporter (DMT)-like permease